MPNPSNKCPTMILSGEQRSPSGAFLFPKLTSTFRETLKVLEADDVIIEPIFNGVCGSDVSALSSLENGEIKFKGPMELPVVMGHEFSGVVLDSGIHSRFKPGDYVSAESIVACSNCEQCKKGHLNQCLNIDLIGLTKDGALSNSIRLKDKHVYSIEKLINKFGLNKALELATLLEPAGCSYNALMIDENGKLNPRVSKNSHVAVFGCGTIGLFNIALAKHLGAKSVVAFDIVPSRLELAKEIGADYVYISNQSSINNYLNNTQLEKANIVLEASGSVEAFKSSLSIIAPRGILLAQGRLPESNLPIDPNFIISEAISIIGVRGHAGYGIYDRLIDWFSSSPFNFDYLINPQRFVFEDFEKAINYSKTQAGKVLSINPNFISKLNLKV